MIWTNSCSRSHVGPCVWHVKMWDHVELILLCRTKPGSCSVAELDNCLLHLFKLLWRKWLIWAILSSCKGLDVCFVVVQQVARCPDAEEMRYVQVFVGKEWGVVRPENEQKHKMCALITSVTVVECDRFNPYKEHQRETHSDLVFFLHGCEWLFV